MSDPSLQEITLESLPTTDCRIDVQRSGKEVQALFDAHSLLHAILLVNGEALAGMISRRLFQQMLTRPFGREVFLNRSLTVMTSMVDAAAFVLPWNTQIHDAVKQALARQEAMKYEPIVVERPAGAGPRWALLNMTVLLQAQSESLARHIGALKAAEQVRETLQNELVRMSRQAGMAEVATGVLHNVGNVLNSVMVSTARMDSVLKQSRVGSVRMTADLMQENEAVLPEFFARDQRGKALPAYLGKLADLLNHEVESMNSELKELTQNVEHIRQIVTAQQSFATIKAVKEMVKLDELLENAIRINALSFERHKIEVVREFSAVEPLLTDKHHVLQVLVNLISNAKKAVRDSDQKHKRVTIGIRYGTLENRRAAVLEVADNGMGIAPDRLTKIFSHGFTTREDGHGFGLHTSANAAKQLGGQLNAASPGPGRGATFTLVLPYENAPAMEPAATPAPAQVP